MLVLKYVSKKVRLIFDLSIISAIFDRSCLFFVNGKVPLHRLGCSRKFSKNSQLSTKKMKMKNSQLWICDGFMHKKYTSVVPRPSHNQIYNYHLTKTELFRNISWFVHSISQSSTFLIRVKSHLKPGVM